METEIQTSNTTVSIEPRMAVVGIGGAGCNVLSDVYWADGSIDTIAINTDKISLREAMADKKVCLCRDVTKGEGAKGDSVLGERCARAHIDEIEEVLKGYDTVVIVAGMGGGTGTGVAPVVAAAAHKLGIITITIPIRPFSFESNRMQVAKEGIAKLTAICPMTVVIDNDKILARCPDLTLENAFKKVNGSIVEFISEKKRKIAEAMMYSLNDVGGMISDRIEKHSISAFADTMHA